MRIRALIIAAVCGLLAAASGGCSSLLGIEDPNPDFGDDTGPRTLLSIAIKPDPLEIPLGVTQQLTAIGIFDDGSESDVTPQTEFTVDSGSPIEVTPGGLAKATGQGMAMVTAKIGKISGLTQARVLPAVPDHLMFTLVNINMKQRQRVRLHAMAVLTDGTMRDETANATYESNNSVVATVSVPGQIDALASAGMATITANLPGARSASVTVNVSAKQCFPMINEVQITGAGGAASDEWVEIINPCTMPFTVTGWTLAYRGSATTGTNDDNPLTTLSGQLQPGDIKLFVGGGFTGTGGSDGTLGSGMASPNGAIALRMGALSMGAIADSLSYGSVVGGHPFTEGMAPLPTIPNGQSAARLPFDGRDDDAGAADFMLLTTTTPRARNVP